MGAEKEVFDYAKAVAELEEIAARSVTVLLLDRLGF